MARPRRVPWFAVDIDMRANEKMVALPNDSARYGWVLGVLAEAKRATRPGQFRNRAHVAEVIGRFGRFVRNYVDVGLLEEAPKLCDRCRADYGDDLERGRVVVHDWWQKQRDPGAFVRQRMSRESHANVTDDDVTIDDESHANVTANVTPHTRARAGRQRQVQRQEPLEEDRSPARADDIEPTMDDVVDALKGRGYRRVTAPQRRLLAEVIDREGWTTVIAWIQTAPDDIDPIEHVKVVSNAGRTQRVTAARRREADHERTKSDEPGPIASAMASAIGAGVAPRSHANGLSRDETIAKFAAFRGVIPDDALAKQLAGHGLTMADLEGAS